MQLQVEILTLRLKGWWFNNCRKHLKCFMERMPGWLSYFFEESGATWRCMFREHTNAHLLPEKYKALAICFHSKPAWPSKKAESLNQASQMRQALYPRSALMQFWHMQLTPYEYQLKNSNNFCAKQKTAPLFDLLERKWRKFIEHETLSGNADEFLRSLQGVWTVFSKLPHYSF